MIVDRILHICVFHATVERATARYRGRDYAHTQAVADAAYFLGFDGLVAPSARSSCLNAMLFTDRIAPGSIVVEHSEPQPVDWRAWREADRKYALSS